MLTIRYCPEAVTPELLAWLRPQVKYDTEGRASRWLVEAEPLPPLLAAVVGVVCRGLWKRDYSGVILQCYRNGRAVTPCHSDAGATGFCFILALGATRTFRIHRVPTGTVPTADCGNPCLDSIQIEAVSGTAILLDEDFHATWHHQVAPDPEVTEERLSLVFRTRPTRR